MKVKLYKKWLNVIKQTPELKHLTDPKKNENHIRNIHELARRYWNFKVPKGRFVSLFLGNLMDKAVHMRHKYRRYSRKYWTAEARMTRMLRGEND